MTEILYHGTTAHITGCDRDICLATEPEIAESYLAVDGGRGRIYTVELADAARIADEDDIRDAATAVAGSHRDVAALLDARCWAFELLDVRAVRDELAARGWHGARIWEANPDNEVEHETVRVWAAGIARVIDSEER